MISELKELLNAFKRDGLPQLIPLELGKDSISIYLWRLLGLFLTGLSIIIGMIIFTCFWIAWDATSLKQFGVAFVIAILMLFLAYRAGGTLYSRIDDIPQEVRLVILPLTMFFLLIAGLLAVPILVVLKLVSS
jgi:hypothetical protein